MGFFKRNWFVILCAVVGLAGVGLMVAFVSMMTNIQDEMEVAVALHSSLEKLQKDPPNREMIAAVERTTEHVKRQHADVLDQANKRNRREPLRDDVFPRVASIEVPFLFKNDYRAAFLAMMRELNPRAPEGSTEDSFHTPTPREIEQWDERIKRRLAEEAEQRVAAPGGGKPAPGRPGRPPAAPDPAEKKVSAEEEARRDKVRMAMIAKARSLDCYVNRDSFVIHEVYYLDELFKERDIWAAQMSLWVQQDVVRAIAEVNNQAAEAIARRNEALPEGARPVRADVSTMPVKHLVGIRLLAEDGIYDGAESAEGAAAKTASLPPTFTDRSSNELFDVIPFSVELIADQRDIPLIIDRIAQANFFTPVNVSYTELSRQDRLAGNLLYGHEPCIRVDLDFEGYYFRETYHYRMPKDKPEASAGDQETDPDEESEDQLEDYPFMPEAVRERVVADASMAGSHRGFSQSSSGR